MKSKEKEISYNTTNSYSTLNSLNKDTKNVWLSFHGLGYLSRYFLKYFKGLNPAENYIIAPQSPNKYYQGKDFKHVGACWLTKEASAFEIENICNYIDAVLEKENISEDKKIILFGYSQGVSIALRYLAKRQLKCHEIVIHSGGIPKELTQEDFKFLEEKVTLIYGTEDEYLNDQRIAKEKAHAESLFADLLHIKPFEGKHVVHVDYIHDVVKG